MGAHLWNALLQAGMSNSLEVVRVTARIVFPSCAAALHASRFGPRMHTTLHSFVHSNNHSNLRARELPMSGGIALAGVVGGYHFERGLAGGIGGGVAVISWS